MVSVPLNMTVGVTHFVSNGITFLCHLLVLLLIRGARVTKSGYLVIIRLRSLTVPRHGTLSVIHGKLYRLLVLRNSVSLHVDIRFFPAVHTRRGWSVAGALAHEVWRQTSRMSSAVRVPVPVELSYALCVFNDRSERRNVAQLSGGAGLTLTWPGLVPRFVLVVPEGLRTRAALAVEQTVSRCVFSPLTFWHVCFGFPATQEVRVWFWLCWLIGWERQAARGRPEHGERWIDTVLCTGPKHTRYIGLILLTNSIILLLTQSKGWETIGMREDGWRDLLKHAKTLTRHRDDRVVTHAAG